MDAFAELFGTAFLASPYTSDAVTAETAEENPEAPSPCTGSPVDACEITGEVSSYEGRGFCGRCGSRLLDPVDPGDTLIEIRLGSLDQAPFDLTPEAEVWVKRREKWIAPVEGAAQHDENR